jgi:hypothetical protein
VNIDIRSETNYLGAYAKAPMINVLNNGLLISFSNAKVRDHSISATNATSKTCFCRRSFLGVEI